MISLGGSVGRRRLALFDVLASVALGKNAIKLRFLGDDSRCCLTKFASSSTKDFHFLLNNLKRSRDFTGSSEKVYWMRSSGTCGDGLV